MTYANHILQGQVKKPKTLSNLRMLGAEKLLLVRMIDTSVCGLWHATVNAYWKMAGDVSLTAPKNIANHKNHMVRCYEACEKQEKKRNKNL
ncbi:MAG: hypothetical protein RR716_05090 [Christensenellaceae bacterium]